MLCGFMLCPCRQNSFAQVRVAYWEVESGGIFDHCLIVNAAAGKGMMRALLIDFLIGLIPSFFLIYAWMPLNAGAIGLIVLVCMAVVHLARSVLGVARRRP